jgi:hypothetical protein
MRFVCTAYLVRNSRLPQLARSSCLRLNGAMRDRAILILLGLTAFGAYSVGRQSAPVSNAPVPAIISSPSALAQPVAFSGPMAQAPAPVASSRPISAPTPSAKVDVPDDALKIVARARQKTPEKLDV